MSVLHPNLHFSIPRVHTGPPPLATVQVPLAVHVDNATYTFGRKKDLIYALNEVNLHVREGSIYGLLGPSGCGKTTLLRTIVGRITPSKGKVRVFGHKPGALKSSIPGPGVGYMPQELALYPEITITETLNYFGRLYHMKEKDIIEQSRFLISFLNLPNPNRLIQKLSGGQKRRVSLAAALIHMPPLLILDEPTVGVDPLLRQNIWEYMVTLAKERNMAIIITTHYIEEARLAHSVGLMRDGCLLVQENPTSLMQRYNLLTLEDVFLTICQGQTTKIQDPDDPDHILVPSEYSSSPTYVEPISIEDIPLTISKIPEHKSIRANIARTITVINKNLIRIRRAMATLIWQFFMPALQIILFCLCIGRDPFSLKMGILNQDKGPLGYEYLSFLNNDTINKVYYDYYTDAEYAVKISNSWGVLQIPENFTEAIILRYEADIYNNFTIDQSTITLFMDMTNEQIFAAIYKEVDRAFRNFGRQLLIDADKNPNASSPPTIIGEPIYGDINGSFTEFVAPGFILSICYGMPLGLTAMAFILERKEGLLERSWVAGVKVWQVMVAHFATQFLIMAGQIAIVLTIAFAIFEVPAKGPVIWIVLLPLLQGTCGMAYGLLLSAISKDELSAIMMALGSFYTNLLLSGAIWPVEAMPLVLKYVSVYLPQTLPITALRSVVSRGLGIGAIQVWPAFIISISWTAIFFLGAGVIFKYNH